MSISKAGPSRSSGRNERIHGSLVIGGLTLLTILFASQLYVWVNWWPTTIDWSTALVWSLPQLLVWSILVPVVTMLSRRVSLETELSRVKIAFHVGASVVWALLGLVILDVSDQVLQWSSLLGAGRIISDLSFTIIHLHIGIAIYGVVMATDHAARYHAQTKESQRQASDLEAMLADARLEALRMQLRPHFLFNTLNSIAVLMRRDREAAERMLNRLSDLLRTILEANDSNDVPLHREIEYLKSYLGIEEERFQDRLTVTFDIDPAVLDARVPQLILQPLVENAIRHGVTSETGDSSVTVTGARPGERLRLTVKDDGPGVGNGRNDGGPGVGLENTRRRLEVLYGTNYRLELTSPPSGGTEAIIELPFRDVEGNS